MREYKNGQCVMRDICGDEGGIYNPCDRDHGICINTWNGAQCKCKEGYRLADNGRDCVDIDECAEDLHQCDLSVSSCINQLGSYRCLCDESLGYTNLGGSDYQCGSERTKSKYVLKKHFRSERV
eukprot:Blabericola_migrator_1__7431@NODE_378_length_9209_cov_129_909101_g302_i0_p9_GENE_NODE_378_length_9209_cov_129_909101_g302_i0NODE_378_length_9209_cov_129_909101_g302_i0_p9_ORF_typecomplete_len124_score10_97EGF_CA/PF07645_15/4_6e05EGF_CA/PF07645_15/2_3e09EGF_CA/PF07645_15/1e03cEGF/PF12662_7/2_2e09cEGF/PF12662_7/36EGF_3/PF12947_7/1_9e03EGF_3/PF12947_7/0_00064EGF_3/PF12947_7/0_00085FXa_inhibition/PF14670_6/1_9e03FXa_inhibition/PF14670_6/5_8e06FXa_inhibition/PF14670_6/0_33hEGF/PF12661_7/9_5e02hEGF/PF